VNAWGDAARMREIEGKLHPDHWQCVPEYKETMGSDQRGTDDVVSGRKDSGGKNEKKGVMKKKSDKNLKALAVIQSILKDHKFTSEERMQLSKMFTKNFGAERHAGLKLLVLDARKFQRIMHATFGITHEKILEGLFRAFDYTGNNCLSEPEWVRGLSIFIRGSFQQRLEFVWTVYDANEDGILSREEMYNLMQECLVKTKADDNDTEEAVKDLVEMLHRKLDINHDGKVDKEDFKTAVKEDPLLLECCGQVFPSQRHTDTFEATFAESITFKPV